ncbi:MAG TPA: nuclease A inhibitor family protein [Myxococcales bacterium]|jgi:hypothetical protein
MSKLTVQNAISQALKTPKGQAQVSKAEAEAIAKAALKESSGQPHVTASEAKLIGQLLQGDRFEGTKFQLTAPARKVLESFAAAQGLPIGSNTEAVKTQLEAVLANVDHGAPLAKAPSTSALLPLTLSDNRPSCGALREALLNPTSNQFYLRTTVQGRGMPKPQVDYFGPFPVKGAVTPPSTTKLSAAELEAQLPKVADGYLFPSETDVSLRFLTGPKAEVDASTVQSAFAAAHDAQSGSMFGTSESTPLARKYVEERDAGEFFKRYSEPYDPSDEYLAANCKKFAAVVDLLKANLTDLHVYRFSEGKPGDNIHAPGQVSIFIAGKTASGELVSVMTGSVET